LFIYLKTNIKINTRQLHALAKLATAEGIELSSLSGRVRNLIAELFASLPLNYSQVYR